MNEVCIRIILRGRHKGLIINSNYKKKIIKILQLLSERCILTSPVVFYNSPLPGYMECYDI